MSQVQLTTGELMLSIVGPTGPAGPAGATGPSAGPTGPTGPGGGATAFLPSGGDDAPALNALMAATSGAGGGVIKLLGSYIIGSALALPSNVTLDGDHAATITVGGVLFRAFTMVSVTNAHLRNIIFDLTSSTALSGFVGLLQGATNCDVTGCTFIHIKGEIDLTGGTTACHIDCNIFTVSLQNAVRLDGAAYCSASYNVISNCTQFGIFGTAGAHHNTLIGNQTLQNGLELIGLQYDCHDNRIISNHAEGTGDNGISVTGQDNVIANNVCRANSFNGIGVYGSHNTVVGNACHNNGQHSLVDPTKAYAGIQIQSAFGGTAQYNTVTGNVTDDDQTVMTQNEGIHLNGTRLYVLWSNGIVIPAATYCSNGSNIYLSAAGGITGASPPVHTAGTVSDGGVLWQYINTFESATREPIGCAVGPNSADRSISGLGTRDTTTNNYNVVIARSYMRVADISSAIGQRYDAAGVVRHMPPWAAGVARTYGQMVYTTLGHTYRVVNTGGTTSVEPTHTIGTVTGADGIAWLLLVQNSREYPTLPMTDSTVSIDAVMGLGQIDQAGVFTKLISGSGDPNGVVSAPKGSLFLRSDGGAGSTVYVREAASLTTWRAEGVPNGLAASSLMMMEGADGADGADSFVPGPAGAAGPTGPGGSNASSFIMLMEGNDGADGADSFVPGPQGLTGATGPAGVQGSQGRPGEDGNDGADSFVPGPAGPAGPAGSIGSNASSFILLMEGNDGADGADSMVPGTAGSAGATGPTGAGGGGITPTPASGNWIAPPYLAHRDQSLAGFVMVINTVYYIPFIPTTTITVKSLGIFVTTGGVSGTTQFAIYGSSTNTGKPVGLPLSSTGSGTSTANNTACTAALGSPATLTLTAGTLYWLAVNTSVAITVRSAGPMSYAASVVGDATFANVLSQTGLFTGYSTTVTFGSWPTATGQTLTPTKEGSLPFPLLQIN